MVRSNTVLVVRSMLCVALMVLVVACAPESSDTPPVAHPPVEATTEASTTAPTEVGTVAPTKAPRQDAPATPIAPSEEGVSAGSAWSAGQMWWMILMGVLALGVGFGLGRWSRAEPLALQSVSTAPQRSAPTGSGSAVPDASLRPQAGEAVDMRVVTGLIAIADLTESQAVLAQVTSILQGMGVTALRPRANDALDVAVHNVVGMQATQQAARDLRIATVVRTGWVGPRGQIRPADVEVYRYS